MGLLIEPGELHARLGDRHLRVADVRWYMNRAGAGRAAYDAGHIPGALFLDLDTDLSDERGYGAPGRHPLPAPREFTRQLGRLGIGSDDFVVAYDDDSGTTAARLWWMLDNLGHRGGAAVLDGGMRAWQAAGFELAQDERQFPPAVLELAGEWRNVIARDDLALRLGSVTLLDVRAAERYRGEVEPIDPKAGHIPTAVNAPAANDGDVRGVMRSADELRATYGGLVVDDRPTVVSCGSGVTACHSALAMRISGMPDPILYVGSFSDWSRSGMPVTDGPEPGATPEGEAKG